jgi:AraC-like DNA-binding protein
VKNVLPKLISANANHGSYSVFYDNDPPATPGILNFIGNFNNHNSAMEGHQLQLINLSESKAIDTLVEHRRVFNLPHCELNIFETFSQCSNVVLSYNGLVVSSMMRGKKTMSLEGKNEFEFLPGETVILPEGVTMNVGFPEASEKNPVQCATLSLDWEMVNKNLVFLNEQYPLLHAPFEWKLNFEHYHFINNKELAGSINKLINISMEETTGKEAIADLALKILLLRLIQTQKLVSLQHEKILRPQFKHVVKYIQDNLANKITIAKLASESCMSESAFFQAFKQNFGIPPLEFILKARIEQAKKLLSASEISITEVCYASGFNNLNYFSKIFKRLEGITPKQYRN